VTDGEERLRALIRDCGWLMTVLAVVRDCGLPDAWAGAGVVRDLVWGELSGVGFRPDEVRDIDVIFLDPADLSRERDDEATERLARARPGLPWEARNQAAVHLWYPQKFGGGPAPPLRSIAEAVATWPETATAVAVRLDRAGEVEVCAPLGLDDLLGGIWRRNPVRVSLAVSRARLARHRPARRWPGIRVIPPADSQEL
jgi:uncharacterized protein